MPVERKKTGAHQQILRELRYEALLNYCNNVGCKTLLLGHHVDDQLGTVCSVPFNAENLCDGHIPGKCFCKLT